MFSRRFLLLTPALALVAPRAQAQGQSGAATQFIVDFCTRLVAIVNEGGGTGTKRQQMQPLIDQAVAVNDAAQFVLGPYWRVATPAQQQRFVQLFHEVLVTNITAKMGEFKGVSFKTTQTQQRDGEYFVGTLISRPNNQPNNAQWVVSFAGGRPQIVDVYAEGTSLRLTQRSDYASYLQRNNRNIDALLSAMERQAGG